MFPGFRPENAVDASRNSVAAYIDVEGDMTGWLRLGAAARAEHYSDFGGTIDGKLTARVQPDPRFVVRGSVSTGFRAPSLAQSFFSSTATNFLNLGQGLVPVDSLTLPVGSPAAKALGAAPLAPENSRNASAGVAITPVPDLEVAVDYYHIAIDDRIVLSGNFTAPPVAALLAPFGANSARFFTNAIDTRTNGVDVTASYHVALDAAGDLRLRAGYNNTSTKIVGTIATPPELAAYASVLFDRIEQRRIECGQPKDNLRLGGDWRRQGIRRRPQRLPLRRVLQLHAEPGRRPDLRREMADRRRRVVPDRRLHGGGRRAEPVRRVPGSQLDRQLVQRHPDVSQPVALRDERAIGVRAARVDVLRPVGGETHR